MRVLLFHCKNYQVKVDELATRPKSVKPEAIKVPEQASRNCVVAFITVESKDSVKNCCKELSKDITKMCREVGEKTVVIVPFAHLSNDLADSEKSLEALECICDSMQNGFDAIRTHFGSHKSLLLEVYGHPGNIRFREY